MRIKLTISGRKRPAIYLVRRRCLVVGCKWMFILRAAHPKPKMRAAMVDQALRARQVHLKEAHGRWR